MNYITAKITFAQAARLPCRYYTGIEGSCARGPACWFSHSHVPVADEDGEDEDIVTPEEIEAEKAEFKSLVLAERKRDLEQKREPNKAARCERRRKDRPARLAGRARKREIVRAMLRREGKEAGGRAVKDELKRWADELLNCVEPVRRYGGSLVQAGGRLVEVSGHTIARQDAGYDMVQTRTRLAAERAARQAGAFGDYGAGPVVLEVKRNGMCRDMAGASQMLSEGLKPARYDPVPFVPQIVSTGDSTTPVKREGVGKVPRAVLAKQEPAQDEDIIIVEKVQWVTAVERKDRMVIKHEK